MSYGTDHWKRGHPAKNNLALGKYGREKALDDRGLGRLADDGANRSRGAHLLDAPENLPKERWRQVALGLAWTMKLSDIEGHCVGASADLTR